MPAVLLKVIEGLAPSHMKAILRQGDNHQPGSAPLSGVIDWERMPRILGYSILYLSLMVVSW